MCASSLPSTHLKHAEGEVAGVDAAGADHELELAGQVADAKGEAVVLLCVDV